MFPSVYVKMKCHLIFVRVIVSLEPVPMLGTLDMRKNSILKKMHHMTPCSLSYFQLTNNAFTNYIYYALLQRLSLT